VRRLKDEGYIERTVAILNRGKLGLGIVAYAFVSLDSQSLGWPAAI
jgi:DNA-binding Lrp family transcriptional regulator